METECMNKLEIKPADEMSSSMMDIISPLQTPEIETDDNDGKTRLKIPLITIDNKLLGTLVEISDYTPSEEKSGTDMDLTPSEERSGTDIDLSPSVEKSITNMDLEKQPQFEEVMDLDSKVDVLAPIDFFIEKNVVELARCSWRGSTKNQRYLKGCLWSPDGTCLLTCVNGDGMHVFETPRDLFETETIATERPLDCLQSAVHIKEGGIVYDYCWFPFMNSNDAATCCWLATRQNEPIQLWDAYYGDLRCSYRGYNAVDEVESALSITFSNDGSEVIGGYKKTIKVFKTNVPGRDYISIPILSPASSLACNSEDSVIAVGSWSSTITLLDLRQPNYGDICQINQHRGGVTYLRFLHGRSQLISGARKDNQLLLWDLRHIAEPVLTGQFTRMVSTNQRIYFDFSSDTNWLMSGDTSGIIHAWNLNDFSAIQEQTYSVHHDCCNGISMHPTRPILATSSGQHHFDLSDIMQNEPENINGGIKKPRENSLILWWCGKTATA